MCVGLHTYPQCPLSSRTTVLTRYLPKTKIRKQKNLLAGSKEEEHDELEEPQQVAPYRHAHCSIIDSPSGRRYSITLAPCEERMPIVLDLLAHFGQNLTLALVSDAAVLPISKLPEPVARRMSLILCATPLPTPL